jgi:PAS domain S-box-containing protein
MTGILRKNLLGYGKYIFIISFFITVGYTLLYVTYENVKGKLIESLNERQLVHGKQAALGIEDFFERRTASLVTYARVNDIIDLNDHGKKLLDVFYETSKAQFMAVTRVDARGRIIYTTPFAPGSIGKDISSQKHIQEIMRTHKPVVSDVFRTVQGFETVALHVPVFRDGVYNGTIGIAINFRALAKRYLEDIRIGDNGYAWMISRDGTELYCPVPGHVGNSVFTNCRDFPDILAMARRMVHGEQGVTSYRFNRIKGAVVETTVKHALFLPVRLSNTFWSIVIATPEEEIIGELAGFRNRLILIALMLLIMIGSILFVMFRNQVLSQEVMRRNQVEVALLAKADELDRYFTGSPELLCITDSDGRFRRLNPQWEKILGYSTAELAGANFFDHVHPDDRMATLSVFGALKKQGEIVNFTNRYRHKEEAYRWIEWQAYVVDDLIYAMARDITERKLLADKLQVSQRQLSDIIDFLPDATFAVDKDGRVTAWNRAMVEMTGVPVDEIIGQGENAYTVPFYGERRTALINLVLKPDETFLQDRYQHVSKRGNTLSAEVFVPKLYSGRGAHIWVTATPLRREDGAVIGAIESIRDISDKRAMEIALRESEQRFKELTEMLPEAIFETDRDLRITFGNKKAFSLYGLSEQDLEIGINAIGMIAPEDQARAIEMVRKRISGEFRGSTEYTSVKKDGTHFPVLINTVPVLHAGDFVGLRGVIVDMTEIKRVEAQIRLQAMVLDQIRDLITVTDLQGNISYVNDAQMRLMGYRKEELLSQNVSLFGDDPQRGATQETIIEKTREHGIWRGDVVNFTKEGREIILDCRTQLVYDHNGKPVAMAGFSSDITEQRRLQQALDENRRDLRMVVDATDDMILMTDAEGRILLYNRVLAERYTEVSDNLTGCNIFDLMSPASREERRRHFDTARIGGMPYFFEDISDGHSWSNAIYPVSDASGRVSRMVLFGRNVSDRKAADQKRRELEERLHRAEKMEALGLLSGGVAHDLNNILGVMVGYSELLHSRIKESGPIKSYAEKILDASERAAAVIQDMLTLARRGVQNRHTLNLNTLIRDFLKTPEFQSIEMAHPAVFINTQLDASPLHILGSPVQIGKTIFNLVANAAEAMPLGGAVTIKTTNRYLDRPVAGYDEISEGDYVVLTVSDTGQGIAQNDIKHIFEPFYTKKVMGKSGTGLGLSVVWGTVKDHNGYINVESREGIGTSFTLYFPVSREDITEKKLPAMLESYMGQGETILVVDDVESQRELAQRMLEKLNYKVITAPGGEAAVTYLKDHRVNLVVLDMIMDPGIDGLDTYRKIIEIHPCQHAIIVSGYAETERVKQLQALGGGEYVMKPYMLETLGMAVKRELERPFPSIA